MRVSLVSLPHVSLDVSLSFLDPKNFIYTIVALIEKMSDSQNFSTPTETPTVETSAAGNAAAAEHAEPTTHEPAVSEQTPAAIDAVKSETNGESAAAAPAEEKKDEPIQAEKTIEPITEGQLAYKGPGLLKYALLVNLPNQKKLQSLT